MKTVSKAHEQNGGGALEKRDESAVGEPASLPMLVIEDNPASRERLDTVLERGGYPVVCVDSETDVLRFLSLSRVSGIVMSIRRRNGVDLTDFHAWLSQNLPDLMHRVVLTGSTLSGKSRAKLGKAAWPFVQQPFHARRFLSVIREAIGEPPATERILVVDDEETIREIIAVMLGLSGYRCRAVAGGGQALKLLASGEQFHLVTSDLANAPLDGVSFLEQIKSKFPEIPFLLITAAHDVSASLECLRKGAYDYLLKPFEREQLIFAVRRALECRRLKLENREYKARLDKVAKRKSTVSRARPPKRVIIVEPLELPVGNPERDPEPEPTILPEHEPEKVPMTP